MNASRLESFHGMLLGMAVGDAIGLPREGLSDRRAARLFGGPPLRHQLLFGRGMISDDTEHACMTGQALLASGCNPTAFARSLAWRLRWWLLGLPAGVGMATARGILRLWIGISPARSGVWSVGNGPAMRAGILGVWCAGKPNELTEWVRASTRLTHVDRVAEEGALVIAHAARLGAERGPDASNALDIKSTLMSVVSDPQLRESLGKAIDISTSGGTVADFAIALNLKGRVTGWMVHTVPVAIFCWIRYGNDFQSAVEEAISLGGDTDTTGAIVGGLVGATCGVEVIPSHWVDGLFEWPRSVRWIRELAQRLAMQTSADPQDARMHPVSLFWPGVLVRNIFFLLVVLAHGLRRILPPY